MLVLDQDISFWFDNFNGEWRTSLLLPIDIMEDEEFTPVNDFDNGDITIDAALSFYNDRIAEPEM